LTRPLPNRNQLKEDIGNNYESQEKIISLVIYYTNRVVTF